MPAFIITLNIFVLKWESSGGGDPGKIRGRGTEAGEEKERRSKREGNKQKKSVEITPFNSSCRHVMM